MTGPTLPPVVRAGSRRVNPEPFLRLVAFCRQVLFYPLNAPRMPARNLSLSSPAPSWSEHPSSLLWIPATSSRLGPLHGRGLLKAIFLEEPGGSFYNANPIASFFGQTLPFRIKTEMCNVTHGSVTVESPLPLCLLLPPLARSPSPRARQPQSFCLCCSPYPPTRNTFPPPSLTNSTSPCMA